MPFSYPLLHENAFRLDGALDDFACCGRGFAGDRASLIYSNECNNARRFSGDGRRESARHTEFRIAGAWIVFPGWRIRR
jgi:hypothetical protein